jgi:hypothetical protein
MSTTLNETEMGTLHIMDSTGDTRQMWNPRDKDEVATAKAAFDAAKKRGMLAYTVKKDGSKGKVITEFDKNLGKVIMTPQLVGG